MKKTETFLRKYGRLFLMIGMLILAVLLVWSAFGDSISSYFRMLRGGDEEAIESFVSRGSFWKGALSVVLLSAMQVISVVFPGFAIQIAAGVIFGWWQALLMCYGGFLLGNCVVFLVVRRMGSQIQGFAPKKQNQNNWVRERMKTTRPSYVVALLNLIPVIPNGIIPYMAAGSSITFRGFLGAIATTSWFQILFNCLAGGFLKKGQYLFMVMAIGLQVLLVVIVALKRQEIMAMIPGGADMDDVDEFEVDA